MFCTLLEQVLVCLIYGFLFNFHEDIEDAGFMGDAVLISIMTILVIVGISHTI